VFLKTKNAKNGLVFLGRKLLLVVLGRMNSRGDGHTRTLLTIWDDAFLLVLRNTPAQTASAVSKH